MSAHYTVILYQPTEVCVVLTIAQLPRDVVLLASTIFQEAQGGGGVPGVVWVSVQRIEPQNQMKTSTVGKVVQFV